MQCYDILYMSDLLSRMSDFFSNHCLLGLLGGVCSCEGRLCVIIYVTYIHGWVISILLTAYLACWAAYVAVRWGCVSLFMWSTFMDEWFLFYSLLTWLSGRRMDMWGEVVCDLFSHLKYCAWFWLYEWPISTGEWFLFYSLLTWLAG